MRISAVEDQALRCLSQIARNDGTRTTISRVAESEGLSEENAAKILARLRDAGLIKSYRGKDGGYVLLRPAAEISIAEVLGAIGGPLFEVERCQGSDSRTDGCVHQEECGIRPVWLTLSQVVQDFLSSITLADLLPAENDVRSQVEGIAAALERPSSFGCSRVQPIQIGTPGGTGERR